MSYGTVQAEKMTTESGYSLGAGNASSFKNRVINGSMTIAQRGTSFTDPNPAYTTDRWNFISYVGGGNVAITQSSTAPAGFSKSLLQTIGTSYAVSSSSWQGVGQVIEANNVSDLGWGTADAKTVTLSFWVRASVTGVYNVMLSNINGVQNQSGNSTYHYISTYTINAANTWEQKTITVTGPTSGSWNTSGTGNGISIWFDLGSGSNYNSSNPNTWESGTYFRTSSATSNISAVSGSTWYLTGVQLEVGTVATSFDYRNYGTELLLCQRYYEQGGMSRRSGNRSSGTYETTPIFYKATKRTTPTFALSGGYTFDGWSTYAVGSHNNPSGSNDPTYWGNMECVTAGGASGGAVMACLWTSTAEF